MPLPTDTRTRKEAKDFARHQDVNLPAAEFAYYNLTELQVDTI